MPQRKTSTSFVKGDKRINRDGRPKNSSDLTALARRIAHEPALKKDGSPVIGQDGKPMTKIEVILSQWAQDPKHQADFVERGFGKVAQSVDPQDVINWTPDEWRKEATARQAEAANTLATFDDEDAPDE